MLMHAAIAGAVLWQSPKAGAESAGIGGIAVSLGPAGGAPGGEVVPVDATAETIEPAELAHTEPAIETQIIDPLEAVSREPVPPIEVAPARPREAPTETLAATEVVPVEVVREVGIRQPIAETASVPTETGMHLPSEPVEISTVAIIETLAEAEAPAEEVSTTPVPRATKIVTAPEAQVATVRPPVQQAMANPVGEPDLRALAVPPPPKAKPRPPSPNRADSKPQATAKVDRESSRQTAQVTEASDAPKSSEARENAVTPSLAGAGGKSGTLASLNAGSGDNTPGGGTPAAMADYYGRLQAWLEKYKRYPRRAKLRNEEGVALLRFVVTRAGEVTDFSIEKSSGHPLLDEEVGEMLRRAQPFPKMPSEMYESRVELLVPVQFYLR
jgi:protein TonB